MPSYACVLRAHERESCRHAIVAIAQGALGNREEAREAPAKWAGTSPAMALAPAAVMRRAHPTDELLDALTRGLRDAGWPPPESPQAEHGP